MEDDEFVRDEGDLDVARQLAETIEGAELFVYPGDKHLFVDKSIPDYDEGAATLLKQRVLSFLDTTYENPPRGQSDTQRRREEEP
jgi:dienelactone hydrolase